MKIRIKSPSGWSNIDGIRRTIKNTKVTVLFESGNELVCTTDHKVLLDKGFFIEAKYLSKGDLIEAKESFERVSSVNFSFSPNHVFYDVLNVSDGHRYYTNGVVSHNCEFLGSSGTLIAGWKLKELVSQSPVHEDKNLKIYKPPSANSIYMLIADVSRGKGLDYSAFSVIDITGMPYEQVAVYRSNMITPTDYTSIINNVARYFNNAQVLIEVNDIGAQVADLLFMDYEYENIMKTVSKGRLGKVIVPWAPKNKSDMGVRTTSQVKRNGCSILKLLIEQNQLIINDHETIHELSTFSSKGSSYEAEPGKHDDIVMGLVLFGWASTQSYFKNLSDTDTMKKLREKTEEEIEDYLLPFGIKDDGIDVIGSSDPSDYGWI